MKKKEVIIYEEIWEDIQYIEDCIYDVSRSISITRNYVAGLRSELKQLGTYGASIAPYTRKSVIEIYGNFIRRANYKKIAIFFYVETDYIIIKKIVFANTISGL